MFTNPGFTLGDQIFWTIDLFVKTLAEEARKRRVGLFALAILARVRRFERRFLALYGMWKAGTLPKARGRTGASPQPSSQGGEGEACGTDGAMAPPPPRLVRSAAQSPVKGEGVMAAFDPMAVDAASMEWARTRPASVLPRGFAWMHRMLPGSAGTLGAYVESLLDAHAELKAFVNEVPRAGRLLRPICRMTGVKAPEWLALPRRKRVRRKAAAPVLPAEDEEKLRRMTARFPDTPAARSAKRALRRMFAGLPVRLERMSAVAVGYFLHPPRDGNCPPPEIGYGGRTFPPLPKDYVRPKWD